MNGVVYFVGRYHLLRICAQLRDSPMDTVSLVKQRYRKLPDMLMDMALIFAIGHHRPRQLRCGGGGGHGRAPFGNARGGGGLVAATPAAASKVLPPPRSPP